ncbi:DUF2274 domain-containing protein [Phenylobacterium sp.]|jgi:hypothetical protein|uniref:DUF2274 domain-containing protein n=1 Tax=Phenylobacterium sp. TaxID=1871053 RepID=UPI0037C8CF60
MSRLKLGALDDDKPVRLTVDLPAAVHRDLVAYADLLGRETRQAVEPARLVAPMLARFMATDRGFASARRKVNAGQAGGTSGAPKQGSA